MSTPVVPDEGELSILAALRTYANANYKVRLFASNTTPTSASVLADFTEASFAGYTSGGTAPVYAAPATVSGQGKMSASQITFTRSSTGTAQIIYGWYLVDTGTSKVVKAERFDAAISVSSSGHKIKITDRFLGAGTIV